MAINASRMDEEQRNVSKKATLIRLFSYLLEYKKELVVVLLIMAGTIAISMVTPLLMERAINVHVANRDVDGLLRIGAVSLVLFLVFLTGTRIRMLMMAGVANRVLVTIRQSLYEHIQTLSFTFFDSRPTGKILARVIGDVNSLKDVLSDSVTQLVPDMATVFCVAVIMVVKNVRLAMAALLTIPVLAVGLLVIETKAHKRWQAFRKKNSNLNAYVHEDLSGIRIIQSFAAEKETQKAFYELAEQHRKSFVDAVLVADGFGPVVEITWGMGGFFLYYIGINLVGVEDVGIGTFVAFSTYIAMFWSPIRNLANFYNKLTTNISAAERIFDILDTKAEIVDNKEAQILPPLEGAVEFSHVSFAYSDEPDQLILKDVSFKAEPGETIALVGPTGAGKTTIVNLISRFYEVCEGTVCLDGHEVRAVTLDRKSVV